LVLAIVDLVVAAVEALVVARAMVGVVVAVGRVECW
jgi:hypothetical protein